MVMLVAEEKPSRDWKLFYQRIVCWGNRQPWLTIRRIIWSVRPLRCVALLAHFADQTQPDISVSSRASIENF